ncbi:MAG: hypothetical protein ABEL76_11250 [Bradymonadaceae bacterium]
MSDDDRLREHPRDRFAPPVRHLDLPDQFEELLSEPHDPVDDHRQITLVKRQGLALILFYFEEDGHIPDHKVDGEVSIHVLDGELTIDTSEGLEHVSGGEILMLSPGVEHDVHATEPTKMLLTVGTLGD